MNPESILRKSASPEYLIKNGLNPESEKGGYTLKKG